MHAFSRTSGASSGASMPAPAYHAFVRGTPDIHLIDIPKFRFDEDDGEPEIRCPLCRWAPKRSSRWYCAACPQPEGFLHGCGTLWNTFDTRGTCPGCHHRWRWTSCLSCAGWSLHDDWYADRDEG
jgi:hypothetical protein